MLFPHSEILMIRKVVLLLISAILLCTTPLYSEQTAVDYSPQTISTDPGDHLPQPEIIHETRREIIKKALQDLKSQDYSLRRNALWALAQLKAKKYSKNIAELLHDPDSRVRFVAAYAIGQINAKEYAPDLIKLLKDENAHVRYYAVKAIGSIQATEAINEIALLLKDSGEISAVEKIKAAVDCTVRGAAATALGHLGAQQYAGQIKELLNDRELAVRKSAAEALEDLEKTGK